MGISWSNLGAGAVLRASGALLGASWSRLGDFLRPSHCHRRGPRGPQDCPKTALCHRITLLAPWGGGSWNCLGALLQPSWGGLRPCPGPSEGAHRRPQGSSKRAPTRLCAIPRTQLFTSWGRAWSRRGALLEPSWVPPMSFPWPSGGPKTATRHLQEGPRRLYAIVFGLWRQGGALGAVLGPFLEPCCGPS